MKIVELHKGSAAIEQISILQSTIDNLKETLKSAETERDQSNEKFQVLTDSVAGRYLKAIEMQDKIKQLEDDKIQLQDDMIEKDIENRKLKQIIGQMQDSLTVIRSQLYESKDAYTRDIVKFQPVLEQHYYKAIEEEKQLQSLRSDANIGFERAKVAEKQKQQIELENEKLRSEMKIVKAETSLKEKMLNQVLQENERLKQINICLTAAKIKFHELAKSNEQKLFDEKRKLKEYDSKMDDTHEEMKEMEQYILQLQQLVENAESLEREANDKLSLMIADKEGDALFSNEALSRLEKVEEAGLSESKQQEFDNMAKKINELENDKKKLNEQLNNAMRKIYDLQLSKTA
jgi:chromosome segregation ATPase